MNTTPEDFRILPLKRDRDAYVLIGLALVIALLVVVGLAFLPDDAWHRLEERSKLLWGALLAAVPVILLAYQRLKLRQAAVTAMGKAASAPITIHETSELLPLMESTAANTSEVETTSPILPNEG